MDSGCRNRRLSYPEVMFMMERIWNEAAVAEFKVLPHDLSGGTEEYYENPRSGLPVSGFKF
jgi:hypothetical protein